ncbi:MAG TPA: GntR family transcriptional regulator [Spirochaetia bacterium]|nr:GntR family transcriptional regulator [Spirochaetia bacterium]
MQAAGDGEGVPKYIQLARILRDIPTESALGQTYRVSRITVRQAIDTLVRDNFLQRRNIAQVYSFTSEMEQMGLSPSSRVMVLAVEEADEETARSLQLPVDDRRVTRLSRVRMWAGKTASRFPSP